MQAERKLSRLIVLVKNLGSGAPRFLIETPSLLLQYNLCADVGLFLSAGLAQYNAMG